MPIDEDSWFNRLIRSTIEAGKAAVVTREVRRYWPRCQDEEMSRIVAEAIWIRMTCGNP